MINLKFDRPDGEVIVRNIREDDLEEVAALSIRVFGEDMSLTYDQFKSQLDLFPEGQICLEYKGEIVGNASSLIVDIEDYGFEHDYDKISGNGYIKNHNPNGKSLYGIEVGVNPDFRGMKIGRLLYQGRQEICTQLNLKSILIGGRMPHYHKYADELSAEEYVQKVIKGKLFDPVITFQSRNGFELRKVIPNYLPEDPESKKYAVLLEWLNENYNPKRPFNRRIS